MKPIHKAHKTHKVFKNMVATSNGQNSSEDEQSSDVGSGEGASSGADDDWDDIEWDMTYKHGDWEEEADRHEQTGLEHHSNIKAK